MEDMTKEEAIKELNTFKIGAKSELGKNALDMAIKALKQETVSKEAYDHEYFLRKEFELKIEKLQRQLDKIRAEINSPNRGTCDYFIVDRIEEIIDKAESEDME